MDLPGFPELFDALRQRMRHPALGYTLPHPRSRDLVVAWYQDRFGARIDPEWIVQLPFGPRAAVRFILDAITQTHHRTIPMGPCGPTAPGASRPAAIQPWPAHQDDPADRRTLPVAQTGARPHPVLVTAPEYAGFAQVAQGAGLPLEAIPLRRTATGYQLPLAEFEVRAARGVTAIVLSSPHNPTGRVWAPQEVHRLAEAAASGGGVLVCDEVHSDLVHPGKRHPVAVDCAGQALSTRTVTVLSIGKTFNVSAIADALVLVPSADLRERLTRSVEAQGFFPGSRPLGALAQDIAFGRGAAWRDSLVRYLAGNRDVAVSGLRDAAPGLVACVPEASYLLWLDMAALSLGAPDRPGSPRREGASAALLHECGLDLQDGAAFGPAGQGFLRLNFALPRPRLREAVNRLATYAAKCRAHRTVPGT